MKKDQSTGSLRPEPGYLNKQLESMTELNDPNMPQFTVSEFEPLLDSSDMDYNDWMKIAREIANSYYDYDGFVVIHGTDTMAYSASALSFMLENLAKPVIFTGSQSPLAQVISDAKRNLVTSVMIAGSYDIPEVCVFFNQQLLRANRAKKIDSWGLQAFDSPNFPELGNLGIDFHLVAERVLPPPRRRFKLIEKFNQNIVVIHLVPGFSDAPIRNLLLQSSELQGLVIMSYGSGNVPQKKKEFLELIAESVKKGVVVVVVSQCHKGSVDMLKYETGSALAKAGAVSGLDMTVEAAAVKLGFLLAQDQLTKADIQTLVQTSLRGELTSSNCL